MKHLIPILMILTACGSKLEKTPSFPESTPTDAAGAVFKADWDPQKQGKAWTEMTVKALDAYGPELLTVKVQDAKKWCPQFNEMTADARKQFLVMLISSMTRFESAFKPESYMYECRKSKTAYSNPRWDEKRQEWCMRGGHAKDGGYVISRGLIQMSLESAQSYGCKISEPKELHDPEKNIACAVTILNKWIAKDKHIGTTKLGGARYWSVLRDTSGSQAKIKAKTLAFCGTLK